MKKLNVFKFAALALIGGAIIFTACKKEDTTAPEVKLNGEATINHILNTAFTDPGATANDDKDGNVAVKVSGTVNKDSVGTYTLTYTATDANNNEGKATRTVIVYNQEQNREGDYDAQDADHTLPNNGLYNETITVSKIRNNRVWFAKFAYYSNAKVYADITGNTLNIPQQNMVCGIAPNNVDRTFTGNGTISGTTLNVNYTVTLTSNPSVSFSGSCTYTKK